MILIDANLLIYAINADAPRHHWAHSWLVKTLSSDTIVGLPWICLLAFLRITTRRGILARPLSIEAALNTVDSWLNQPFVELVRPADGHWAILRNLLRSSGTAGNLTSDAHVAALALERGAAIYSADYDFGRFPGVEHVNPLEAAPMRED